MAGDASLRLTQARAPSPSSARGPGPAGPGPGMQLVASSLLATQHRQSRQRPRPGRCPPGVGRPNRNHGCRYNGPDLLIRRGHFTASRQRALLRAHQPWASTARCAPSRLQSTGPARVRCPRHRQRCCRRECAAQAPEAHRLRSARGAVRSRARSQRTAATRRRRTAALKTVNARQAVDCIMSPTLVPRTRCQAP